MKNNIMYSLPLVFIMMFASVSFADSTHTQQGGDSVATATNYAPVNVIANPSANSAAASNSSTWSQNTNWNANTATSVSGVTNSGNSTNWNSTHQNQGQFQTQGINDSGNSSSNSSVTSSQANNQIMTDSGNSTVNNTVHGSSQSQSSTANNAGNAQNVTMNTPRQYHNTPSMATFVPMPTSPCMVTFGGSGSGAGFGFGFAAGLRNEDCNKMELSTKFAAIGHMNAALEALCATEAAKDITVCRSIIAEKQEYVESKQATEDGSSSWFKSAKRTGDGGSAYAPAAIQTTVNMNHPNPWLNR